MKNLVTVAAQQLLSRTLIEFYQGLIYPKNLKILVVNGQGVGEAVKNSQEKLLGFRCIIFESKESSHHNPSILYNY